MTNLIERKKLYRIIEANFQKYFAQQEGYPAFYSYALWIDHLRAKGFEAYAPEPRATKRWCDKKEIMDIIQRFKPYKGTKEEKDWDFRMRWGGEKSGIVFMISAPTELALKILVLGNLP